jgi:N-acetylglucosamine-6-phosphate deacetylase
VIALEAAALFDGGRMHGRRVVAIEGGRVVAVMERTPPGVTVERLPEDAMLAPGFVDLQVNGGGGVLFNDSPTPEGLHRIAAAHARLGTTSLLPTLVSAPRPLRQAAMAAVRTALTQNVPGICGLHLEGPFLASARRGIHPAEHLRPPTGDELAELRAPFPAPLLLTVAPEIVPPDAIAALAGSRVAVFLGHSDATLEQAAAALRAGALGFTHLFNAMSQLTARAPGMVGAALDNAKAACGIIVDGLHVHPAAIRIALAVLGPQRLFLVSDAMPTVGESGADGFVLNGRQIRLVAGRLTDAAGTLAGAHLSLAEAARIAVQHVGLPREVALRMATATPAGLLRLSDRGRIRPGARADLVALDGGLAVVAVWQGGQRIR